MTPGPTSFERSVEFEVPVEEAFAWHERPGALERLAPPWEKMRVISMSGGIETGAKVVMETRIGPIWKRGVAEHTDYRKGRLFRDVQREGPFAEWDHTHEFSALGENRSRLDDRIRYRLPLGPLGALFGGAFARSKIESLFRYRHMTVKTDLERHASTPVESKTMRIAVSGASGLVGSSLLPFLTTGGHTALRLDRSGRSGSDTVAWNTSTGELDAAALGSVDAVVHLAGAGIADKRWSTERKELIRSSRVQATEDLCRQLAQLEHKPKVLVCASAIGFYGNRGDESVDETSPQGDGFLANVVEQWEKATAPAREAGIRVVNLRFGVILTPAGGALKKMLLPFQLGGGGPLGSGQQYMSWVALDDVVGAIHHAIVTEDLSGPVNVVAPSPVRQKEFARVLGRVLKRPAFAPMPAFVARLLFGELANELLLEGQKVRPKELEESGYHFACPELEGALRHLLGR